MIHAYYEVNGRAFCQVDALGKVCDLLHDKFGDQIKIFNSANFRDPPNHVWNRYSPWNLSIENPENGKYFLISYMDYLSFINLHENFNIPKIVEIFATTGRHEDMDYYNPINIYATPISNTSSHRIIDRYYQVKDDDDLITFVSENGRKWYEENGTVDACANIIYNLLDFNKLK